MPKRQLIGTVSSNKMQKTLVVKVERIKEHPKYKRRYKFHKKYKAHFENGEYGLGDKVVIEECRPMSKGKKWTVIKKISSGSRGEREELGEGLNYIRTTPSENS